MTKEDWKYYWQVARVEIKSTNTLAQELAYGKNENFHKALAVLRARNFEYASGVLEKGLRGLS